MRTVALAHRGVAIAILNLEVKAPEPSDRFSAAEVLRSLGHAHKRGLVEGVLPVDESQQVHK